MDAKAAAFTLFLFAGNLKSDVRLSWLPVDLTVLAAAAVLFCLGKAWVQNGFRIPVALFWVCGLFASFLLPVPLTEFTDYSVEKTLKLFSLTFLCAAAPLFLFKTEQDLRRLWNAVACVAMLMAFDAVAQIFFGVNVNPVDETASGITAFGSNTIALGRTTGMALVWIALLGLEKKIGLPRTLFFSAPLVIALVGSGSRGPLLLTFIVLALSGVLFYWKRADLLGRFAAAFMTVSLVCMYGFTVIPDKAATRIEEFLTGDFTNSELMRVQAYGLTWDKIGTTPWGTGWGGFETSINLWPGDDRQYPHNLLLEVLLEGGWLAGGIFLALIGWGLWKAYRGAVNVEQRAFFALFLFTVGNAMVSGDINDNKEFFALLGLSLGFPAFRSIVEERRHG